jgi:hypothetical protein
VAGYDRTGAELPERVTATCAIEAAAMAA